MSRRWLISYQDTRLAIGRELECPRTRRLRSSTSSTRRSTRVSPIPRSKSGSMLWAAFQCRCARRVWQVHRRRNREMGQGHSGRQHQAGVISEEVAALISHTGAFIMKLPRRQFLHLAAGAAALPAVSRIAWAQTYPTRPVRLIVGFPAGSACRHRRAPDGSMAVGAARPAIRHRKPAGRRQQYRHRGRSCVRRRTATRSS